MNRKIVFLVFWTLFPFLSLSGCTDGRKCIVLVGSLRNLALPSPLSTLVSGMKWKSEKMRNYFRSPAHNSQSGDCIGAFNYLGCSICILGFLTSSVIVMAATGLIFELALSSKTVVRDLIVTVILQ